jgi:protein TonB
VIRDGDGNARTVGLLATSTGVHMLVFAVMNLLPSVSEVRASLAVDEVDFVVAEPEPLPPPPEPEAEPEPEPAPKPERVARPVAPPPPTPEPVAEPPAPADDAPVDFTGETLTAEGPGPGWTSVVGNGKALGGPVGKVGTGRGPGTGSNGAAESGPTEPAPGKSQARRPEAPTGLDRLLEDNFPRRASQQGVQGVATVRVRVLPDGQLANVRVLSQTGDHGFGEACIKTVSGARWRPALDAFGRPVPYDLSFTCRFEIRD